MRKELSEMTLDELWGLFPIVLTEHKDCWAEWYGDEQKQISAFVSDEGVRISHVGSTSIKDIWAKPIIDILVELPVTLSMEKTKQQLIQSGYLCMCEHCNRIDFNKGYTDTGFAERVFHLHLRYFGDNDELYFRDYLNDNPAVAKQYEALKLTLSKQYEHNRDAYTNAKGDFVKQHTQTAKRIYGERYSRK